MGVWDTGRLSKLDLLSEELISIAEIGINRSRALIASEGMMSTIKGASLLAASAIALHVGMNMPMSYHWHVEKHAGQARGGPQPIKLSEES
jgi:hypothetical protein